MKEDRKKTILLTGTTGYLGIYLLYEFLTSKNDFKIFCLIRSCPEVILEDRTPQLFEYFKLQLPEKIKNIQLICGDLSQPQLGLSSKEFYYLAEQVDEIFHVGASLNIDDSYETLAATNVYSTQLLLKLATTYHFKIYNYVSSLSVFETNEKIHTFMEEDEPNLKPENNYSRTKWESEKILINARKTILPSINIFRIGAISGDSKTGIFKLRDLFWNEIIKCIQNRTYPILTDTFTFTPVDFVAKAISYISQLVPLQGKNFHIVNPNFLTSEFFLTSLKDYGFKFDIYPKIPLIIQEKFSKQLHYDSKQTFATLKDFGIQCEHSAELLFKYLKFLKSFI